MLDRPSPLLVRCWMPKTILLIDDDEVIRALARMGLELHGHEVLEAEDGPQGLALAQSARPDLVLLDGRLPGMGGPEILQALQGGGDAPPVIFLSAAEEMREAMAGVVGFIAKPFDPVALGPEVARLAGWGAGPGAGGAA